MVTYHEAMFSVLVCADCRLVWPKTRLAKPVSVQVRKIRKVMTSSHPFRRFLSKHASAMDLRLHLSQVTALTLIPTMQLRARAQVSKATFVSMQA